jgi:hypothetical protein
VLSEQSERRDHSKQATANHMDEELNKVVNPLVEALLDQIPDASFALESAEPYVVLDYGFINLISMAQTILRAIKPSEPQNE